MIERFTAKALLLLLTFYVALPLRSAEQAVSPAADQTAAAAGSTAATNAFHLISPGPIDGQIANLTAQLLHFHHYSKKRFDEAVSSQFLDLYLETLDPQRIHFTQADLAEFERYRTNLNRLTDTGSRDSDTKPAFEVFNRFMERLEQRTAYVNDLLKHEKFTFDTDERITINRKEMPYPKDLDEAQKLWRERLRFEYLQELLGKIGAHKKNQAAALKKKPLAAETNAVVQFPKPPQAASADVTAGQGAPPSPPAVPALMENRHPGVLQSPKDAERALALQLAAEKARAKEEAARATAESEARAQAARLEQEKQQALAQSLVAALTNHTTVATPKKTDDEEIVETLTHRYHRNLQIGRAHV